MTKGAGKQRTLAKSKNVVRYVGGSQIDVDSDTGGLQANPSAFDRKLKDVDGLSFIQCFVLAKNRVNDIAEIRKVFASRCTVGKTAQFVELNVGQAIVALGAIDSSFYFCEDPQSADGNMLANPAHALLIGLPFKGESIGSMRSEYAGELLVAKVISIFPAMTPKQSSTGTV
jgi:hypothetical protein